MKYKVIIFFFCFLFFIFRLSAADTWTKTYRPFYQQFYEDEYSVEDVIVTQDGGYVVSGSFELYDEFYYEHWGFLMKTDSDGNMLWARKDSVDFMSYNGYSVEFVETSDGGFLTIGFQGFAGDRYIMKRDSEGNYLWALPYGNDFGVFSMQNTQDGNIILAGRSNYDAALRKITTDGVTLWTKVYDLGGSLAYSVYQASDGGYLLTGNTYPGDDDVLVIKTDETGDSLWTRTFDGYGDNDYGYCVIETGYGNILVGGAFSEGNYKYGILINLYQGGGLNFLNEYNMENCYVFRSITENEINGHIIGYGKNLSGTTLNAYNSEGDSLWLSYILGKPGGGDKCVQKTQYGGFLCTGVAYWYDYIILNKADSLGQVYSIDDPGSPNNNISINIFPNPILDNCTISFNNNISLKDPHTTVYNIKGQLIRELECSASDVEFKTVWDGKTFDGKEVQNGIYFLKLESDDYKAVKKVTKIK